MILRLFLLCFVVVLATSVPIETERLDSLKLVHVFVRHGARYPQISEIYPKDPHKFDENDLGHLNKRGKSNSYKVGKFLKKRYGSYLGDVYKHGIIKVISTSLPRTKMTALLVLAGLFPPTTSERWSDEIPNWQPVPYDYIDGRDDTWLLRPTHYCPKYKKEVEKVQDSPAIRTLLQQHADTLDYIRNNTGKDIQDLEDVFRLYQLFSAEDSLGLALPDWATQVFPYFVLNLTLQRYVLENSNNELRRLSGGRMLSKVTDGWNKKINNKIYPPNTKMLLFSVHEHNLVNLMFSLGIFNYQFPKYSSAIIFELHEDNATKKNSVRILHLEDVDQPPLVKKLKDCPEMCPLNEFLVLYDNVLPKNYTKECETERNLDIPEWIWKGNKKRKH
ncbi:venom acid phosphatase Acph-1-like [Coccinella septempunctata]|uniref:venom acid phosphatase Acph-1-like n=1 Tax=Coccinella septempunctata TaxID=41139 RepID=UPI001D0681F3|nr:venom acid phosphatase Acph-1-like [Coccinella septempunctata]